MSNPRIRMLEPPYSDELTRSFELVMPPGAPPLNIFRTVGRSPRVLSRLVRSGLLDKGPVSIAQRELVILRACARCGAEYEWGVHVAVYGAKAGFSQAQIAATTAAPGSNPAWDEEQQCLIDMVDELHAGADLCDASWTRLREHFEEEQLIELIMLAGLYHAVSFIVNGLRVPPEDFAPSFPG